MFAVEMQNITKLFGENLIANKSVNLKVNKGEIHALVGENGAGKSTLMKILYGMYEADSGSIKINGREEIISSPAEAIRLHIGMVHQHFMLVNPLTVLENIILGLETTGLFGKLDLTSSLKKVQEIMLAYKIRIDPGIKVSELSVGLQQRVEILKILYRDADILILDEPTAVLTPQEIDDLFNTLKDLKEKGKTIILITHKLGEVMQISDHVTVMKQGIVAGEFETSKITAEEIARLMVGYNLEEEVKKPAYFSERVILEVNRLTVLNDRQVEAVKDISFKVYSGEILGIAGVEGNGQNELVQAVTSLRKPKRGTIRINGKEPGKEVCAHIPADRQKDGVVMDFSIAENIILGRENEDEFSNAVKLKKKEINRYADRIVKEYDIRILSPGQRVSELSGGNQQKVIAARELSKVAELIVANHPTRGLDIKASDFVHKSILSERNKGKAILLVSSDLSELMKLSDRIAVMFKGEIAAILDCRNTNERELGLYMTGSKKT